MCAKITRWQDLFTTTEMRYKMHEKVAVHRDPFRVVKADGQYIATWDHDSGKYVLAPTPEMKSWLDICLWQSLQPAQPRDVVVDLGAVLRTMVQAIEDM